MTIKIHQDILHKYTMCQTVYRGIYSNENAYHSFRQGKYLKNVPLSFIKIKIAKQITIRDNVSYNQMHI